MLKNNTKEIISLVKNDFIPLEESKEGFLKGGFGSVIIQTEESSVPVRNDCICSGNNCHCLNECNLPDTDGNNCNCGTTTVPPAHVTSPGLTDGGIFF